MLGLRWDAVDFNYNTIAIQHTVVKVDKTIHQLDMTKNDSSNDVLPLPDIIKSELLRWREQQKDYQSLQPNDYVDERYICTFQDGRLISPDFVRISTQRWN